jgi:hypothetical protein
MTTNQDETKVTESLFECARCGWTPRRRRAKGGDQTLLLRHLESCGLHENWPSFPHPTCSCVECVTARKVAA